MTMLKEIINIIKNPRKKRAPHSEETRKKMSKSALAREPMSQETKDKMSRAHSGKKYREGSHHTEETKALMSRVWHGREQVECPHCGKVCFPAQAKQWHFEKCKMKP